MKYSYIYQDKLECRDQNEVFEYLINNLKPTISSWDYFINWEKVFGNIKDYEIDLNSLNYLIGKENIEEEFKHLLRKNPGIYRILPALAACRQNKFKILVDYTSGTYIYNDYKFYYPKTQLSEEEIQYALDFAKGMGIIELFSNRRIKNCVDYLIGVEVGLDSNGRKNRGGSKMEEIVEFYVGKMCNKLGYKYIVEATPISVKEKWNVDMSVDKSSRRVDFAIYDGKNLTLIETNFYTGSGSKLKSTAGEYKTMHDFWNKDGHTFVWITDGAGWNKTKLPLEETFNHIDHLLNLDMLSKGILDSIISIKD